MANEKKLYLIAITLPDELNKKVHAIKQQIASDYQSRHALHLPGHITLQKPFHFVDEIMLIKSLTDFKIIMPPFHVELEGYGAFVPSVIYISVKENQHLQSLYQQLKLWLVTNAGFESGMISKKPFTPHVTVAYRDLSKAKFATAWEQYRAGSFSEKFPFSTIDLWRHDGKYWNVSNQFQPCLR